jgi:hypothetical protein
MLTLHSTVFLAAIRVVMETTGVLMEATMISTS